MKTKLFLFNSMLWMSIALSAQQYTIRFINTDDILIAGSKRHVGDVFLATDTIFWQNDKQAMKVEDTSTHEQFVLSQRMMQNSCASNTIRAYRNVKKNLSSRGNPKSSIAELAQEFSLPIGLKDEILLPLQTMDSNMIYYLEYEYGNEAIQKAMEYQDGALIITRDQLYSIDGRHIEQAPMDISLYRYDTRTQTSMLISNSIVIPL